jgi:hypothetical protein
MRDLGMQNPRPATTQKHQLVNFKENRDLSPRLLLSVASTPLAQGPYFQKPAAGRLSFLFLPPALHLDPAGNPTRSTGDVASRQPDPTAKH